jgi:3'-phosphoadenosine 5'-phosphosulfate sulfotransferase (PAPS reductase)/FAD synthetase
MAEESDTRAKSYQKHGCNAYDLKTPQSRPLMIWTEQDILKYIKDNNIEISKAYGEIIFKDGTYKTTGERRTGCVACLFGYHDSTTPDRFESLKNKNEKLFNALMLNKNFKLAYEEVLKARKQHENRKHRIQ